MKSWKNDNNRYKTAGYRDRAHYLRRLASSLGLDYAFVETVASELGYKHDFTTLPLYLEDYKFLRDYT